MEPFAVHKHLILLDPKTVKIALFDFFERLNCNRNRMRAMLGQGLKETAILNPSDFELIPLDIIGFL